MAKIAKTAATKGRETKLSKKSVEELIQIILRKDKLEKNLNAQIVGLKREINTLSVRIKGYDADMQGTEQTLEAYKDKINTLQENHDVIALELKESYAKFEEENKKVITLTNEIKSWKIATFVITVVAVAACVAAVL